MIQRAIDTSYVCDPEDAALVEMRSAIHTGLQSSKTDRSQAVIADAINNAIKNPSLAKYKTEVKYGTYDRQLLIADRTFYYSVMMLTWSPGAQTPIHGHNSYGAVGVYEGSLAVECFQRIAKPGGEYELERCFSGRCSKGEVANAFYGASGIHRLSNPTDETAVSIHFYRMDLSDDASAINDVYCLDHVE